MPVLKRRQRIVTFRLSSEEYELLEQSSVSSQARSISEFARTATMSKASMLNAPRGLLTEDLATLSEQLGELDTALRDLRLRIRKVLGSVQPRDVEETENGGGR